MYAVYILESQKNGRYYIGYTADMDSRLAQHNSGKVKSIKYLRPLKVIYTESLQTSVEARRRERYLKSLKSRTAIQQLINTRGISSVG